MLCYQTIRNTFCGRFANHTPLPIQATSMPSQQAHVHHGSVHNHTFFFFLLCRQKTQPCLISLIINVTQFTPPVHYTGHMKTVILGTSEITCFHFFLPCIKTHRCLISLSWMCPKSHPLFRCIQSCCIHGDYQDGQNKAYNCVCGIWLTQRHVCCFGVCVWGESYLCLVPACPHSSALKLV